MVRPQGRTFRITQPSWPAHYVCGNASRFPLADMENISGALTSKYENNIEDTQYVMGTVLFLAIHASFIKQCRAFVPRLA